MNSKDKKILIVATKWPSKEHPYLVHLFFGLKKEFPQLALFLSKKGDLDWGSQILGKANVDRVLEGAIYSTPFSRNPFRLLKVILLSLYKFKALKHLYDRAREEGYSGKRALGQCYFYHEIVGKRFDLVYFNALQIARHFCIKGVFPRAMIMASSRGQDFDLDPAGYDKILMQLEQLHVLGNYLERKARDRGYTGRIFRIPPAFPGVDMNLEKDVPDNKIIIATAARLHWTKGHEYALRAVHALKQDAGVPVEYWVFGEGPEREKLLYITKQLGLEKEVHFMGWQNEKELLCKLQRVHFYILLSLEEGFNNSVILAQHLGIPCIVSDAGGLPENVEHSVSGYVIPRYTFELAAAHILQLATDKVLYKEISSRAKDRVQQKFNLKDQVSGYVQMFKTALNE